MIMYDGRSSVFILPIYCIPAKCVLLHGDAHKHNEAGTFRKWKQSYENVEKYKNKPEWKVQEEEGKKKLKVL